MLLGVVGAVAIHEIVFIEQVVGKVPAEAEGAVAGQADGEGQFLLAIGRAAQIKRPRHHRGRQIAACDRAAEHGHRLIGLARLEQLAGALDRGLDRSRIALFRRRFGCRLTA